MADSLFGQLGLDIDPESLIKQRTAEAQAKFNKSMGEQAANLPASQRGIFTAAATLGRALSGKPVAQLTDKEKQKLAIMDKSNQILEDLKKTDKWKGLSPRDRALAAQDAIGQAAIDMGDVETGSQILLDTASKRQGFKIADKELEKLGAGIKSTEASTESSKVNTDLLNFKLESARLGDTGTFAVPSEDSGQFDFKADPDIKTGKIGQDGVLRTSDGKEFTNYLSTKDFDMFSDNLTADVKARAKGGSSATTNFLKNFGAAERKGARMAAEDIGIQTAIISTVGDIIKKAGGVENAEKVVGTAGGFVRAADSMFRTLRATAKNINTVINVGGQRQDDGSFVGGKNTELKALDFAKEIHIPDEFANNAIQAAQYRSAIMQAVYIDARLAEPGARQLSDADIKNAMDRLGVRTNNPASIFKTLMQNMDRRTQGVRRKIEVVGEIGAEHGLKADQARRMIFGKDAVGQLEASQKALDEVSKSIFGTVSNPVEPGQTTKDAQAQAATSTAESIDFGDGFSLTPIP